MVLKKQSAYRVGYSVGTHSSEYFTHVSSMNSADSTHNSRDDRSPPSTVSMDRVRLSWPLH